MATAQRVATGGIWVPYRRRVEEKHEVVTSQDGKEVDRVLLGRETVYVNATRFQPSPDNIIVTMNPEEAYALLHFDFFKPNENFLRREFAMGVARVIDNALRGPVSSSSKQATQPSAGQGSQATVACGLSGVSTKGLGWEPASAGR